MKLTITVFLSLCLSLSSLVGCGAFSDETNIEIDMYGIATAPATATGDKDPQFQTYLVQSISLDSADGPTLLLENEASFKVIDRPQILVSRVADDYVGKAYTGITVTFGPTVVGGNGEQSNLSFDLSQASVVLSTPITIEKGKTKTYSIKASWANTISAGTMTEPSLVLQAD